MTDRKNRNAAGEYHPAAFSLSGASLKWIAVFCMLIDHLAWAFVSTDSALGQLMHLFGRITAPTICFLLTEGYRHTRSFKKYLTRMLIFAAISYLPFLFFLREALPGSESPLAFNMLYTLSLCLMALWIDEHLQTDRNILLPLLGILSLFGDWPLAALLFTLNFSRNRLNRKKRTRNHCLIALLFIFISVYGNISSGTAVRQALSNNLYQLGMLLPLPLIDRYNGQKGKTAKGKAGQYFFYWFYPIHLLGIGLIKFLTE